MDTTCTPDCAAPAPCWRARAALSLRRCDPFLLLVIALPFAVLWFYRSWIITYPNCLDPWYSIGYFLDLRHSLLCAPNYYASGRLAYWLPGALVYSLFPPLLANYVLRLAYYLLAVLAYYDTAARTLGRKTALVGTFALGCYWHFLGEIGWNYVDGAGIAYLLAACAALARAADGPRRPWMAAAGFWFGAAVFTNVTLGVMAAPLAVFHLWGARAGSPRRLARLLAGDVLCAAAGFVLLAAPLAAYYYHVTHGFILAPSFGFARGQIEAAAADRHRSTREALGFELASIREWGLTARWLDLPAVVACSSALFLAFRYWKPDRSGPPQAAAVQWSYLLLCGMWVGLQYFGVNFLVIPWYASYLTPFLFLALAAQLRGAVEPLRKTTVVLLCLAGLWLTADFFRSPIDQRSFIKISMASWQNFRYCLYLGGALLLAITAVVLAGLTRRRVAKGLALSLLLGLLAFFNYSRALPFIPTTQHRKDTFRGIMEGVATIRGRGLRPRDLQFWYKPADWSETEIFTSLHSVFLWGYTSYPGDFPQLPRDAAGEVIPPRVGTVVLLTRQPGAFETARVALRAANVDAQLIEERQIQCGKCQYTMVLLRTDRPLYPLPAGGAAQP